MRNLITAIFVVLVALLQLSYPTLLTPAQAIPDFVLLLAVALAMYFHPATQALWWVGLAGLSLDLWQPSHFGTWIVATFITAAAILALRKYVFPRQNPGHIFLSAGLALAAGILVVWIVNNFGVPWSAWMPNLLRVYLPKLLFDLVLMVPVLALARRLASAGRGRSASIVVNV